MGAGQQGATIGSANNAVITGERSVRLVNGDTVRLMLRNMNGVQVITVGLFALSLAPN